MRIRIVSFNVNGLRARIKADVEKGLNKLDADIICLQEVRAKEEQLPKDFLKNYKAFYSIHTKAGYAGATTFIKKDSSLLKDIEFQDDFIEPFEKGRVAICNMKDFILINAYVPNAGSNLERLPHRVEWQNKLLDFIKTNQNKNIILCGDLNVAPLKMDSNVMSKAGTSYEERKAFQDILNLGFIDIFRELNPNVVEYTWFNKRIPNNNAFAAKPKGMRLDEFVINNSLKNNIIEMKHIYDEDVVCGSDHTPIILDIDI